MILPAPESTSPSRDHVWTTRGFLLPCQYLMDREEPPSCHGPPSIRVQKIPLAKKVFCVSPGIFAAKKRKNFVTKFKKFNPLRLTMKMKFNYKNATKFVIRLVPGNRALILRALGCMGGVRPLMRLLLSEKGVVRMKTTLKFLFWLVGKDGRKEDFGRSYGN